MINTKRICLLFLSLFLMFSVTLKSQEPKNIILVVVDGFSFDQLSALMISNGGTSNLFKLSKTGFLNTADSNSNTVNPIVALSQIATGTKPAQGGLGIDNNSTRVSSILDLAHAKNKATGLVSTASLLYPSTAAFYAHQSNYQKLEKVSYDLYLSDIDVFIGGGMKYFKDRTDDFDVLRELRKKGYKLIDEPKNLSKGRSKKIAAIVYPEEVPNAGKRDDYLNEAWHKAFRTLIKDERGYFLVISLPQQDWACHSRDEDHLMKELKELDAFIGRIYNYVGVDKETLLVVVSAFENGSIAILESNVKSKDVKIRINSTTPAPVLVPVFANGPGSEYFTGVYSYTNLFEKLVMFLY
ncbi:alkaline phosphatase [Bacteroidota bacterium]